MMRYSEALKHRATELLAQGIEKEKVIATILKEFGKQVKMTTLLLWQGVTSPDIFSDLLKKYSRDQIFSALEYGERLLISAKNVAKMPEFIVKKGTEESEKCLKFLEILSLIFKSIGEQSWTR